MDVKAFLTLERSRFAWQESSRYSAELRNDSSEDINAINSGNWKASATLSVTDPANGKTSFFSRPMLPEMDRYAITLGSGGSLIDEFKLSNILSFPSCGTFELRAHYRWIGGETSSEPIVVDVIPTEPRTLMIATTRGSQRGEIVCVWTEIIGEKARLHLSKVSTALDPKFLLSERIAEVPAGTAPVLSIPANTLAKNQYIGWVEGALLKHTIVGANGITTHDLRLPSDRSRIVPPILEDPLIEGAEKSAEALLVEPENGGWRFAVAVLDGSRALRPSLQPVAAPLPQWMKTIYKKSGERYTFMSIPQEQNGDAYSTLALARWRKNNTPSIPIGLHSLKGKFLFGDVLLSTTEKIVGATLMKQRTGDADEYYVQCWSLDPADKLVVSGVYPVRFPKGWEMEHAIMRVNGAGEPFVLLKGGPNSSWYWRDRLGDLLPLGTISDQIGVPADIFFVEWIYPALVYNRDGFGLCLHSFAPLRPFRPPTGAW